ncbi:MAG: hypothetical protein OEY66_10650 [Gammaproteobacteria bacterium]|nr:hypothetical protein [Gammaproteobacteria bacterium]
MTYIYGSEAAYLPLILIILIGMPSSLAAYWFFYFLISNLTSNYIEAPLIETNLIILCILFAGYLQWFILIGRVISNEGDNEDIMRNVRNMNAGSVKNKSNNALKRDSAKNAAPLS